MNEGRTQRSGKEQNEKPNIVIDVRRRIANQLLQNKILCFRLCKIKQNEKSNKYKHEKLL